MPVENLNKSGQLLQCLFSLMLSDIPGRSELITGDVNDTAFNDDTRVYTHVTQQGFLQIEFWPTSPGGQVLKTTNEPAIVGASVLFLLLSYLAALSYFAGVPDAQCDDGGIYTGASSSSSREIADMNRSILFSVRTAMNFDIGHVFLRNVFSILGNSALQSLNSLFFSIISELVEDARLASTAELRISLVTGPQSMKRGTIASIKVTF